MNKDESEPNFPDWKMSQHVCSFSLEFESQRTCLKTQLEYEESQLNQQKKKLRKVEETIEQTRRALVEQKKVVVYL